MRYRLAGLAVALVALGGCIPNSEDAHVATESEGTTSAPVATSPSDFSTPPADFTGLPTAPEEFMSAFTAESVLEEWNAMAKDPLIHLSDPRVVELGVQLQTLGPDKLDPLFDVLADPDADPAKKVLVVVTLQNIVDATMTPKLIPLTSAEYDVNTRSAAAQLISLAQDPSTRDLLLELSEDDDTRIRLAALQGLALMNNNEAIAKLQAMYTDEGIQPAVRDRIVQTLARFPDPGSLPIYRAAAVDVLLEPASRFAAVVGLGDQGTEADLAVLDEAADNGGDPNLLDMIDVARQQISARSGAGAPENPAPQTGESPETSNQP